MMKIIKRNNYRFYVSRNGGGNLKSNASEVVGALSFKSLKGPFKERKWVRFLPVAQ